MKKIGLLALVLVLAFGALGVGYAHWSQSLFIEGTVDSGSLTVGFVELFCNESYEDPPGSGIKKPGEADGKDVGKVECKLEGLKTDPITGKMGYETAVVTITNAYPCYQVHIIFTVRNLGTVPVIFDELVVSDPSGELTWDPGLMALVDAAGKEILNFEVINLIGEQIDPCNPNKAEVDVHVKQDAIQKHTYTFKVALHAIQWNKY